MSAAAPDFPDRLIRLFERLHPLDRVPRAGYLLRGVPEPESVAAHGLFVAMLALVFTEQYPDQFDRGRTLAMALIHDIAEAELMDIPMPRSHEALRDAKAQVEQAIFTSLFSGFAGTFADLHREYQENQTAEARLVHALDKLQMMLKVYCYDTEKRGTLAEFWESPASFKDYGLSCVTQVFDTLLQRANKQRPTP
ncbi:MAG: HD domain-containing protein [Candidatus Hydrogenedentes bacterium]|nr:HD domain-containing protein [Candidatus Hydrogenedentota bacterium]